MNSVLHVFVALLNKRSILTAKSVRNPPEIEGISAGIPQTTSTPNVYKNWFWTIFFRIYHLSKRKTMYYPNQIDEIRRKHFIRIQTQVTKIPGLAIIPRQKKIYKQTRNQYILHRYRVWIKVKGKKDLASTSYGLEVVLIKS